MVTTLQLDCETVTGFAKKIIICMSDFQQLIVHYHSSVVYGNIMNYVQYAKQIEYGNYFAAGLSDGCRV
jgi:hypothetical protein